MVEESLQSRRAARRAAACVLAVWLCLGAVFGGAVPGDAASPGPVAAAAAGEGGLEGEGGVAARPKVAVVLGGGAARGFSHIGLLKALEENGIPIDILVGTSMGSIVAGLYASGLSTDNLAYLVTQVDMNQFFTPRIPPRGGFVETEQFELFLNLLTDYARLEDLPIPYYSVITDLVSGEEVALASGPIGRAILASIAIPGMFPPVEIDGIHYVDGGLLSPVPVGVAQEQGADFIIAVDVRRTVDDINFDNVLTNLQLSLYFLLDKNTDEQARGADVIVAPDVADNSYMEYDLAEFFIEEGYRAAMAAMDEIRAGLRRLNPDFPFDEARGQAGVEPEEFARRVDAAVTGARAVARSTLAVLPDVTLRPDAPPHYRLDVHVPLGESRGAWPWFADYSLAGQRGQWHHTLGVGAGRCSEFCLSVFARPNLDGSGWNPGLRASGTLGPRTTVSGWSGAWTARWEQTRLDEPHQWHVQLRWPAPKAVTAVGRELLIDAGLDSRGLLGRPADHVRAAAVYRHYFLGEPRNLWELLRGGTHWYVGGGASASWTPEGAHANPVVEAGMLFEGYLFGLYRTRSRLAVTYEGGDELWFFRISFGD